ncbi:MAG: discoidin domain-containing protein [Paludibacteraceae bacterium]|nr:discoidin domain-containing protein [Paludibacteraceae bacterium]
MRKFGWITVLCSLISLTVGATQYCGEESVRLYNPNYSGNYCDFKLICLRDGSNYVVEAEITSAGQTFNYSGFNANQPWKKGDAGYYNISSYIITSNGNKTVTITFPWEPQFSANAQRLPLLAVSGFACAMPTDVEWGICSAGVDIPIMKSVSKASATENSITLNVEAIVNGGANPVTQYTVAVNGGIAQPYFSSADQITITGLSSNTEYTFTVRAQYAGNISENYKTVTASTNKASECEGTRGHFANPTLPKVNFEIAYEESTQTVTWTLTETEGRNLTWAKIEWDVPGVGSGAATSDNGNPTFLITLSGSSAIYSYQVPDNYVGKPMGIMFLFDAEGISGRSQTAENKDLNNPDVIYYVVGACGCAADDGQDPVMGVVNVVSATATTVNLHVEATDNSGTVNAYVINGKKYNSFGSQITVDGLSMCTNYTFDVYAMDPSCRQSANATSISFKTLFDANFDILESAYAEFGYEGNVGNRGEKCIDGVFGTRGGTQNGSLEQAWLTIDLSSVQTFNRVDIYWEDAIPGSAGYDIEASMDDTHYTKIGHYGQPDHHTNTTPTKGNLNHLTRHDFASTQARYIRVKAQSLYRDDWGISIWEIEVYNVGATECPEEPECPQIINAYLQAKTTTSATLNISVVDMQTPNPDDLEYDIHVVCSPDNLRLESDYHYVVGEHSGGIIPIEGLVPGAPYEVTVKVLDGDTHTPPCDEVSFSFRTPKGDDCAVVIEDNKVRFESEPLPTGLVYTYALTRHADGNGFDVVVTFNQDVNAVSFAQHFEGDQPGDCYSGWVEHELTRVDARRYVGSFSRTDTYTRSKYGCDAAGSGTVTKPLFPSWPNLQVALRIVTTAGTHYTLSYPYDPTAPCDEVFAIYHHDDLPAPDLRSTYAGGTIEKPISYLRLLNPGIWEDLTVPFEVDSVIVFDEEDKQYYKLKAQYNDGSVRKGQYLMRIQQPNVSGEGFVGGWHDGNTPLPQKNQPYAIRFTSSYYQNKFVRFMGHKNQTIASSFSKGATPSAEDQYMVYGNNTMDYQSVGSAYLLPASHNDETYRLTQSGAQVRPFETYVLANAEKMAVMPVIGRWREHRR